MGEVHRATERCELEDGPGGAQGTSHPHSTASSSPHSTTWHRILLPTQHCAAPHPPPHTAPHGAASSSSHSTTQRRILLLAQHCAAPHPPPRTAAHGAASSSPRSAGSSTCCAPRITGRVYKVRALQPPHAALQRRFGGSASPVRQQQQHQHHVLLGGPGGARREGSGAARGGLPAAAAAHEAGGTVPAQGLRRPPAAGWAQEAGQLEGHPAAQRPAEAPHGDKPVQGTGQPRPPGSQERNPWEAASDPAGWPLQRGPGGGGGAHRGELPVRRQGAEGRGGHRLPLQPHLVRLPAPAGVVGAAGGLRQRRGAGRAAARRAGAGPGGRAGAGAGSRVRGVRRPRRGRQRETLLPGAADAEVPEVHHQHGEAAPGPGAGRQGRDPLRGGRRGRGGRACFRGIRRNGNAPARELDIKTLCAAVAEEQAAASETH